MSVLDPKWKYHNAEASKKPGYLARRMAEYRKQLESKPELRVVLPITRRKAK